jgi:hypothetical protein
MQICIPSLYQSKNAPPLPSLLEAFPPTHSGQREAKMHLPPAVGLSLRRVVSAVVDGELQSGMSAKGGRRR